MHMEGGALAPSRLEHAASAAAQSRSHAQAKAQGVADKTHARFSPSAANRRIHCPPSLLLEEQFEEGESVYAAEGTAGHTPAAAPAVSSTVGLKNMVIAPVTADTETATTYGDLQRVAGAIEATITPENNDPDIQYFDDGEGDVLYPDPELTFKTKLADLPLIVQEMIFSNKIDDNSVLIRTANDKPGYFAVGFMSEKANGTYRYVWLFKVRAKPVTETYATKEGTSITRQTGEVEWTAIKRTSDGRYQAVADEGENGFNGFTAEKAATFLNTVYTPVFTTSE